MSKKRDIVFPKLPYLNHPVVPKIAFFIGIFVIVSGLTGSWLINAQKLLFPFYFSIYGSAGKSILFGLVTFLLLTKDELFQLPVPKWNKFNLLFLLTTGASLGLFFVLAPQLLAFSSFSQAPGLSLAVHASLWLAGASAVLSAFGWQYLRLIVSHFRTEFGLSFVLATVFYFLFGFIFQLWPYLSAAVLWAVVKLLSLTQPQVSVVPPLMIQLPQFSITIGEYCSGIESLFLITTLYILIGCLEWKKIKAIRLIALYFPLIIGTFCLNIIRVYLIIQAGIWLSPQIASTLFHTYLGMILFLGYFLLFLKWTNPYLKQPLRKD